MTVKTFVRCDGPTCMKEAPFHLAKKPEDRLPDGWYEVRIPTNNMVGVEPMHFCSLDCLHLYGHNAIERAKAGADESA